MFLFRSPEYNESSVVQLSTFQYEYQRLTYEMVFIINLFGIEKLVVNKGAISIKLLCIFVWMYFIFHIYVSYVIWWLSHIEFIYS